MGDHKGDPYIFYVDALGGHKGDPYIFNKGVSIWGKTFVE